MLTDSWFHKMLQTGKCFLHLKYLMMWLTGESAEVSMVPVEHESSYPPPPSRVQLERSHRADPDEDLDNRPGHRRAQSVPAEKLQVKVW